MDKYVSSSDGVKIHYQEIGKGSVALVFVHGWLGTVHWWDSQQTYFKEKYKVVQIDLGGHGKSGKTRQNWTSKQYADDIKAVLHHIDSSEIILIGHSMSGAFVLEASLHVTKLNAIILVDTLKDLDQIMTYQQAEQFLFTHYRKDFESAVKNILPQHLFVEATPPSVKSQIQQEFLQNEPAFAVHAIEPLYKMDIQQVATLVSVPVRAINSDTTPTNMDHNRKYFIDYDYVTIKETGHYPMLEKPVEFNELLEKLIQSIIV